MFAGLGSFVACDGDDSTPVTPKKDAGPDVVPPTEGGPTADIVQKGKITGLGANAPAVQGATVTIAGKEATTDARGEYSIAVGKGQPFNMRVRAAGYYGVLEQEWSIDETTDRGRTTLISEAAAGVLIPALQANGLQLNLGVLAIIVKSAGACADIGGAVVNVTCNGNQRCYTPPQPDGGTDASDAGGDADNDSGADASDDAAAEGGGGGGDGGGGGGGDGGGGGGGGGGGLGPRHPFIAYFRNGVPAVGVTDVDANEAVSAIAYNLPIGSTVELKVAKTGCQMKPYPVTAPGEGNPPVGAFTYTGKITMEPVQNNGVNTVSAARVYLQ
jgi:hypothetical protein